MLERFSFPITNVKVPYVNNKSGRLGRCYGDTPQYKDKDIQMHIASQSPEHMNWVKFKTG